MLLSIKRRKDGFYWFFFIFLIFWRVNMDEEVLFEEVLLSKLLIYLLGERFKRECG